nr:RNA-directed DNA polymerase homolog [Tanacetum cinerariifolium]
MDDQLKRAHQQLSYLTTLTHGKSLKNAYLICDIYGGVHEANECDQNISHEQVSLSGGEIYDDPYIMKIYQNKDIPQWGNYIKDEGEVDLHWVFRSKFKDDMTNFMMKKEHHLNGLREMLDHQKTNTHEQFYQVFTTLRRKTSLNDPAMAITTRSGTTTHNPPYLASHTSPLPHEQAINDEIRSEEPLVNHVFSHPRHEVEPLEWREPENHLKPSIQEPPKLELKELLEHLEKLKDATQKDHFPLSFIDNMLKRLAGHEYYCFLDGFSGYFQILIAPKDQEKTTFT